jgi:hypothetical protein
LIPRPVSELACRAHKTEHTGAKHGRGAYWGSKYEAKKENHDLVVQASGSLEDLRQTLAPIRKNVGPYFERAFERVGQSRIGRLTYKVTAHGRREFAKLAELISHAQRRVDILTTNLDWLVTSDEFSLKEKSKHPFQGALGRGARIRIARCVSTILRHLAWEFSDSGSFVFGPLSGGLLIQTSFGRGVTKPAIKIIPHLSTTSNHPIGASAGPVLYLKPALVRGVGNSLLQRDGDRACPP